MFKGTTAGGLELYCLALFNVSSKRLEFLRPNFVDLLSLREQQGVRNEIEPKTQDSRVCR